MQVKRFAVLAVGLLLGGLGAARAAGDEAVPSFTPAGPSVIFGDDGKIYHVFPLRRTDAAPAEAPSNSAGTPNLSYHGGGVIAKATAMNLWWGTAYASDVQGHVGNFFGQFGTSAEYQTITQYYSIVSGSKNYIKQNPLGGTNRFDTSTPPSVVSDSQAQQEIIRNFQNGNLGTPARGTVYFLYLPDGVTSTSGGSSSCVNYCGYHSNFFYGGIYVKYAVMPYPSCGGCQGNPQAGLSIEAASLTIVSGHEMREAATDPLGTSWYDVFGQEADDKCAWQLFVDNGYQYQKEWSNATNSCVMKGVYGP